MPVAHLNAGKRLLPHAVDDLAKVDPDHIVYEIPSDRDLALPYRKITARDFSRAIDRASWWLEKSLGAPEDGTFPTVGYVGPGDLRYIILVVAAVKVGYKMLYTSSRNSVEGDVAVIKAAQCNLWLVPDGGSSINRVFDQIDLKTFRLPDLLYFLDDPTDATAPYKYSKSWEDGRKSPCWVLHTSGSTGNPKPVTRFQDSIASIEAATLLPPVDGRPLLLHDYFDSRVYLTFPLFHAAGLANGILWPLFWGTTVVLGPDRPVTLEVMKDVIRKTKVDAVFTAPSLAQDISHDEDFLHLLEAVKAIAYAGGPLAKDAGDRIIKHTKLRLSIGTTESGWLPCVETDVKYWNYLYFHPQTGLELQDRGGGLYELVAVRKAELEPWQPIFSTFPELQEYPFKDLFSRHPVHPTLYTYEGRADNVIVLSNGEKFQPHTMELAIASHPAVRSAVVAGQGRFQISLLIEPAESWKGSTENTEELRDIIWQTVVAANESAPAHARLSKEYIIIAKAEKPFARTSKGTIRRGPTLDLYKEEFDNVYDEDDATNHDEAVLGKDQLTLEAILDVVRATFREISLEQELKDTNDFFTASGIDSLQVMTLRRRLRRRLPINALKGPGLDNRMIYQNPTVATLAKAIYNSFIPPLSNGANTSDLGDESDIQHMLWEYTKDFPLPKGTFRASRSLVSPAVVILTGSTGSLGSYFLNDLMHQTAVQEIWCLNRTADAEQRQLVSNTLRGLRTDFASRRVRFLHADLSATTLGLSSEDLDHLQRAATHVIHTQWRVDFNLSLTSFEPQIQGVRNLIDFVAEAVTVGNHIRLLFTSSVGIASNNALAPSIPESRLQNSQGATTGYGKSKFVAEELLLQASEKIGIDVAICRVGQIAGPIKPGHLNGEWKKNEWLPSIIQLSQKISTLPQTLAANEVVEWIPVDLLSTIVLELAFNHQDAYTQCQFYNCVNPKPVHWEKDLLPSVKASLQNGKCGAGTIKVAPFADWLAAAMVASGDTGPHLEEDHSSAFSLIDFFSGLGKQERRPRFLTEISSGVSLTLRELPPVSSAWMKLWLKQWNF